MATNILRLSQLIVYLIISSQLIFYFFILSDALKQVSLQNFIELRKIIDITFGHRFKIIYYSGFILSLAVVIVNIKEAERIALFASVIALICLAIDIGIAMKGNVPINNLFNQFEANHGRQNWSALRTSWLKLINARAVFICIGMVAQFVGLLWCRNTLR